MCAAQVGEGGVVPAIAVLHPVVGFAHVAVATIDHQIRLRPDVAAEVDEFIGAEGVRFQGCPSEIVADGACLPGPDAVPPAITGHEVAAGVAHDGHAQFHECLADVGAQAPVIRQRMVGVVDATVDATAEVFSEPPEDMGMDGIHPAGRIDVDCIHGTGFKTGHSSR